MYRFIYIKSIDLLEIYKDDLYLTSKHLKEELSYIDDNNIIWWCEVWLNNKNLLDNVNYEILIQKIVTLKTRNNMER